MIDERDAQTERFEKSKTLVDNINASENSVKDYQHFTIRLIIFLFVVWFLFFQVIGITHMPNEDMYPRIDAGDLVLYYRLDKDVKAQDVIAVEKSMSKTEKSLYILRVIATEGDTVEITDDRLLVNGNAAIETNIFYDTYRYEDQITYPIKLGKDECFVLADKRDGGEDSRYFGVINKKDILGTVIAILRNRAI